MSVATTAARPAVRRSFPARKVASRTCFYVLIALFVVGSLFPFYWIVITSLKTQGELASGTSSLLPGHISWGSYKADLTETSATGLSFGRSLLNSAIVALATTAITVVLAVLAGYALARIFVEFFREPDAFMGFIAAGTTMGQWLSLPMLIAGGFFIWRALRVAPQAAK